MKTTLILALSCASLSMAQNMKIIPPTAPQTDPQAQAQAQTPDSAQQYKRLASVTWDLDSHKLVWTVQKGGEVNGVFVPKSVDRYEVSPSEASMALKEEKRPIADDEASSLHDLLSVLSMYCVESTVWWEHAGAPGASDPVAPDATKPGMKKTDREAAPDAKPTRVDDPAAKPKVVLIPGALVAANGGGK